MATVVQDAPSASRFEISVDGELAGWVDYRRDGDVYELPHTRVLPAFEGRGVGSELVVGALQQIAERDGQVMPFCPFVPKVIRDHPEFVALVPEDQRDMFGV